MFLRIVAGVFNVETKHGSVDSRRPRNSNDATWLKKKIPTNEVYKDQRDQSKQNLVVIPNEYVFRLDVTVNHVLVMSILQASCKLFDVSNNSSEGDDCTFWMSLAQRAVRGIIHDEKRDIITPNSKIYQGYNMGVLETNNSGFIDKLLKITHGEMGFKYLDRRLRMVTTMLSKKDFPKTPAAQKLDQTVASKVLSDSINHLSPFE